jgi:hypothetical protein
VFHIDTSMTSTLRGDDASRSGQYRVRFPWSVERPGMVRKRWRVWYYDRRSVERNDSHPIYVGK